MKLPLRSYNFYAAVDPGFGGAIALMNKAGTSLKVWDMPVTKGEKDREREIDLDGLRAVFIHFRRLPDCCVGIEWPTTRPGEGAERSERFGRGKGYLEAFAFLMKFDYFKIAPNLWKGRLGLPGKEHANANKICAEHLGRCYPDRDLPIRGPRGGVLDGRVDALLLAHFLRTSGQSIADVSRTHGRGSVQVLAALMAGSHKKRRRGMLPNV